ncbi:MAG: DoxX-like family protein [Candidatus Competibacter sp.]|nr:DoxX-like family protein [Candidatus Competibacter sp.]
MTSEEAAYARMEALAGWRSPFLRATLALIWLAGGVFGTVVYPVADSLSLLARAGIEGLWAWPVLYAASALDIALAWASLAVPGRRLWLLQSAVIGVYSLIVAVRLPEFLIHPFGPVVKNLAILCLLVVLFAEESRP